MGGVPVDIPEGSPLPHAEVQAGLTYRRRGPVASALAAEIKVWRDALRALRSMSRQSAVASVTSGLICGLVMFVFCVVFSEMIFGQHELLMRAVPLGVGTQTMTTMIGALVFARFSGCRAVIAGPDINPMVFLAEAAKTIMTVLCPNTTPNPNPDPTLTTLTLTPTPTLTRSSAPTAARRRNATTHTRPCRQ